MFYSQDFAPNENLASFARAPSAFWYFLRSGSDSVPMLENAIIKSFFSSSTALDCNLFFSGRSALFHLLISLSLPNDSEIIIQSFTCTAVAMPIIQAKLTPIYVDINQSDFSADIDDIRSKVTDRTKAIILQHTFGITPECRQKVIELCQEKNIFLIEDAAHGLDKAVYGSPRDFDKYAVLLSFGRSKLISSVFGACVVTPNKVISQNLKNAKEQLPKPHASLVLQCLAYKYLAPLIKSIYNANPYFGSSIHRLINILNLFPKEITNNEKHGEFDRSFDCIFPNTLAAILHTELDNLPKAIANSRKMSAFWSKALNASNPNPLVRYPYLCQKVTQKAAILSHLKSRGIILGTWYKSPIAPPDCDMSAFGYTDGSCPRCEDANKRIINLPLNIDQKLATIIANTIRALK